MVLGSFVKLTLKEGPINDFEWLPNGKYFVVNSGNQPATTQLYDTEGNLVKELSVSKTNTIKISPDSRILCLAGFGNLVGDIEFHNLTTYQMIGKLKFHCANTIHWSEDSSHVVISVLAPRLKEGNEYKVSLQLYQ